MKKLSKFFNAKTIAVIGVSRNPGKVGHVIFQNLILGNYLGKTIAINPNAEKILEEKTFPSILKVKEKIDLAIIAIPAKHVIKAVKECAKKKIKNIIIISGGFSETGNKELEEKLLKEIKKNKLNVIGPNCLGILDSYTGIDTLFLPHYKLERPKPGEISFISQSGALGSAIIDWLAMKGYGLNKFISYGNAININEVDLLEWLAKDNKTKVIACYIEGLKQGKRFLEASKKISKKKPIIFIKGGRFKESAKAVKSHTASISSSYDGFKALFKQANLIEAHSMSEVFDFARIILSEPKPKGKKIMIITNGGGYGVLASDALKENDLEFASLSNESKKKLKKIMPSHVIISNPMDLTGDADNERFKKAIEITLKDKNINAIIINLLFQVPTLTSDIIQVIKELNARKKKPLIIMSAGGNYSEMHKRLLEENEISTFSSPFNALKALKKLIEYHENINNS